MKLIDSHTHLYLQDFDIDLNEILDRALNKGVTEFYLPSIDSAYIAAMLETEKRYPGKCFAMMGLHPCSVKENYQEELSIVHTWLQKRKFAGIGETGLDFFWDRQFVNEQYESFHRQIEWALEYSLPVIIHTRNAMQETINVVRQYTSRGVRGIFHCFSGDHQNALDIIDAGFLLGIGGVVTYKNAGVAEAIKEIDLGNIVIETDAPYLTPVPFRGRRNESSYITYVAEKIAAIKDMPVEEVARATTRNAETIFKA